VWRLKRNSERKVVIVIKGIEWASTFYNDRLRNAKIEIETGRERKRLNQKRKRMK
jgi:hypothetical protein